jgi:hypothetical protein
MINCLRHTLIGCGIVRCLNNLLYIDHSKIFIRLSLLLARINRCINL